VLLCVIGQHCRFEINTHAKPSPVPCRMSLLQTGLEGYSSFRTSANAEDGESNDDGGGGDDQTACACVLVKAVFAALVATTQKNTTAGKQEEVNVVPA
jgi:hypothetical protein